MPIEKTSPSGLLSPPPRRGNGPGPRPYSYEQRRDRAQFLRDQGFQKQADGTGWLTKGGQERSMQDIMQHSRGQEWAQNAGPRMGREGGFPPPGVRTGGPLQGPQQSIDPQQMMEAARYGYMEGSGYDAPSSDSRQWQQLPGQFQPGEQGPWQNIPMPFRDGQSQQVFDAARYGYGVDSGGMQGPKEYDRWRQGRYPGQPIPSYVSGWSRQLQSPNGGMNPYAQEARRRAFNQRGIPQGRSPISEMKVVP